MKKISTIIAMATIMTVGGVYATFNYAQNPTQAATGEISPIISDAVTESSKGEIKINSTFEVIIDDLGVIGGGSNSYYTGMKTEGTFKVSFTPNVGADADVRDNGIKLNMKLSFTGNKYDEKDIFVTNGLDSNNTVSLNEGNKILGEYEIKLTDYFGANEEIKLSTHAEYKAYENQLKNTKIIIEISEASAQ